MTVFMNPESLIFYGFTVKEIDRCPTVFSIQTHISCHICLCESVENSLLTRLICGHIFHSMCLIEWAFQRGRCGCIFGCLE
ncbi:Cysteine-rich protein [Spironucleus salmonicida]|uniref:Cysteine-rich protein n=1 Tax=Spironucleus salmonicida TaxID=348837 RepID=V6LQA1_9EUKA|nr:Cysteine-rich protein [Spironucleus salmonicida]|eukprot:EST46847.1 Cysteine-rich protein [Spironucleus salmonicida]